MLYGWYVIPGFTGYEINFNTMQVRSLKHYKKDCFHIMKVRSGKVTIVDDYGSPTSIFVNELYNRTFNSGYPLVQRGESEVYRGAMCKVNRNLKPSINILTGEFINNLPETNKEFVECPFSISVDEEKVEMIKPFIFEK